MAQGLLTTPGLTADEIKALRQRYLEGTLSEPAQAAFERNFPQLVPKPAPSTDPTTPTAAPGELTLADIGRIPFGGTRGAISTAMGSPADLISLIHMLGNLPLQGIEAATGVPIASPPLNLPGGSAEYREAITRLAEALGYVRPASFGERLMETVPEEIASNLVLTGGLSALKVPQALAGGTRATDILMGAGSGVGRAVGAEAGEGGEAIGGVVGGVAPAVPRLTLQGILRLLGVRGLSAEQRQMAQAFTRYGIDPLASDVTGARGVAQVETLPTRFPFGVAPTQRFAERQLGQAQETVQRTLQPLGMPIGPEEAGLAIRTDVGRQLERQREGAEQAAQLTVERAGGRRTFVEVGVRAAQDIREGIRTFTAGKRKLFNDVEALAGDVPVVTLGRTKATAGDILEQSRQIGSPAPRGTAAIQRLGEPAEGFTIGGVPVRELPASFLRALPAEMRDAIEGNQPITFALARRIETEMGRIGYASRRPVPDTSVEGAARRMYHAIRQDLDEFLTSPSGADVAPALAEAKQIYANEKRIFNDSVNRAVTRKDFAPEKFIEGVFNPRADVTDLLDFKLAVSPETYERATASFLAHGFDQAISTMAGGIFQPEAFVRWAQPYLKSGRIDQILEPTQAGAFRTTVSDMAELGRARITQFDKLLGTREPEKLIPLIFDPKVPSRTSLARTLLEPDVYNDAARAWAQRMYQDSLSIRQTAVAGQEFLSPTKLATRLEPYIKSGQLEVILADFPRVAEQLRDVFPLLRRMGRSEVLAGNPSGTAQAILGAGQILSGPALAIGLLRGVGTGDIPILAASALATGGTPLALAHFTTSRAGVRVLSEGLADKFSPGALRLATRILGSATAAPRPIGAQQLEAPAP